MAEQIVILGAGYGGIKVAHLLDNLLYNSENNSLNQKYNIILIDKHDYHTLRTQLYQPATGSKDINEFRVPMNRVLNGHNVKFVKGHIDAIDFDNRQVIVNHTEKIPFKYLVNALGSEAEYFNIPGLQENSISLNSLRNACRIKKRIEQILADLTSTPEEQATIVIGGGGLTGVQFAGELTEQLQIHQHNNQIKPKQYKIVLVEGNPHLLPGMSATVYKYAKKTLKKLGVEVVTGAFIKKATADTIYLSTGREINYTEFVWTGGVRANRLAAQSGLKTDVRGRVEVNQFLQCAEDEHVYVIGDSAFVKDPKTGKPVIATAQAAMQQGKTAAYNIFAEIMGLPKKAYQPSIIFLLIHIGQNKAVGEAVNKFRCIKFKGPLAVHIKNLIPFKYSFILLGGIKSVSRDLFGKEFIKCPTQECKNHSNVC
ncbi:MAG: NAD(P)/FAD-dependent oxidoreductase [Firmicutes bacterium]|nr:NAD(P)/FAD-dependent oxidoreductase [Bacillota bacterium]